MQHGVPERQRRPRDEYDYLFKFLVVGDERAGKSCLLLRYADGTFTDSFITTIGVDFKIKNIELDEKSIKLQIWDLPNNPWSGGAEYRGVHGIILAFDMTNVESFADAKNWHNNIGRRAPENVSVVLVGTKADDVSRQVVSPQQAKAFADSVNIPFIATSAKSDIGVDKAFTTLAQKVFDEQFKPKIPVPVPPPPPSQPETIGIGRRIANILLWPFRQIWAGLRFIGRGFLAAGRGIASLFHRSPNNAVPPPQAAPQAAAPVSNHQQPISSRIATSAQSQLEALQRQREEAQLRAQIAALEQQTAASQAQTAISNRQKTQAELDAASAKALLERKQQEREQQRARENDHAIGPGQENGHDDNKPVGPAQ